MQRLGKRSHVWALLFGMLSFPEAFATLSVSNNVQFASGYDSNVFKAFQNAQQSQFFGFLLKSRGSSQLGQNTILGWNYQGGGKIFLQRGEQNQIIQKLQVPFRYRFSPKAFLLAEGEFEWQEEADKRDAANVDINEDYLSPNGRLALRFKPAKKFNIEPYGYFRYFRFDDVQNYSFNRREFGLLFDVNLGENVLGTQYAYGHQDFLKIGREDRSHWATVFWQNLGNPLTTVRYAYLNSNSNDNLLDYQQHRLSLLVTLGITQRKDAQRENTSFYAWTLHFLGTFQTRQYPSVFSSPQEDQRFLLTGAEDENFNSITFKASYHFDSVWAAEVKYAWYANELSSKASQFTRHLAYLGFRYGF